MKKKNMFKIDSYRKGIVLSSIFNIVAKGLMFFVTIVIAYYFGAQIKTDIYFYVFAAIMLFASFIANLDFSVLIPESMRLKEQVSMERSMEFLNFFLYAYILIGLSMIMLLYIYPVEIFSFISKFSKIALEENLLILIFSIPLFMLIVIANYFVNILASYKYFTLPTAVGTVNSSFILVFVFLFHNKLNILSIVIGILAAYLINISILYLLMKKNLNWKFKFKYIKIDKTILKNIFFSQAGNITTALSGYAPLFLFSGFNPGIITALNYGQKTSEFPSHIITAQFSPIAGIKFNELYAKKDFEELNRIFISSAKFLLFILIPIALIIFIYSYEVIEVLFKRGAFDQSSVVTSSGFLRYFSLLIPILAVNMLIARLFMAGQKIKEAFWYQVIFNITLIIFIFNGVHFFGILGYPIALLAAYILNFIFCYFLLKTFYLMINYIEVMIYGVKLLLVNGILCGIVYCLKNLITCPSPIINLILGVTVYLSGLFLINAIFHVNEDVNDVFINLKAGGYSE